MSAVIRGCAILILLGGCGDDGEPVLDHDAPTDASPNPDSFADAPTDAAMAVPLLEDHFGGNAWTGWRILGGVASATVVGGRGRLVPTVSGYSLARMGHPLAARDVEITYTLEMADTARQGVGFYVRQNGGYLQQTTPRGTGFAVFVEAFRGARIGLWHELDGQEIELIGVAPPGGLMANVPYAVRFRCVQNGNRTDLSAKIWPATQVEPAAWTVQFSDPLVSLQDVSGAIAVDAWNTATTANDPPPAPIFVDDIVVRAVP